MCSNSWMKGVFSNGGSIIKLVSAQSHGAQVVREQPWRCSSLYKGGARPSGDEKRGKSTGAGEYGR
jgi:hypothetical protein